MKFDKIITLSLICVFYVSYSNELIIRNCTSEYINNGYSLYKGGLYKLHRTPQCWANARAICDAEGAYLAIINSADEANYIVSLMNQHPAYTLSDVTYKDSLLIGFHDFFREGEFVTIHGEDLDTAGYYLWESGQPNGWQNQNCGSLSRRGLLNDFPCDIPSIFVCEVDAKTTCMNDGRIRPAQRFGPCITSQLQPIMVYQPIF